MSLGHLFAGLCHNGMVHRHQVHQSCEDELPGSCRRTDSPPDWGASSRFSRALPWSYDSRPGRPVQARCWSSRVCPYYLSSFLVLNVRRIIDFEPPRRLPVGYVTCVITLFPSSFLVGKDSPRVNHTAWMSLSFCNTFSCAYKIMTPKGNAVTVRKLKQDQP